MTLKRPTVTDLYRVQPVGGGFSGGAAWLGLANAGFVRYFQNWEGCICPIWDGVPDDY